MTTLDLAFYGSEEFKIDSRCGWIVSWFYDQICLLDEMASSGGLLTHLKSLDYDYVEEAAREEAQEALKKSLSELLVFFSSTIRTEMYRKQNLSFSKRLTEALEIRLTRELKNMARQEGVILYVKPDVMKWADRKGFKEVARRLLKYF